MVMKCYKVVEDCDCLDQISKEAMTWIRENTDLMENWPHLFWNKIDYKHFLLENPTLVKWCADHKLAIREVAVLFAISEPGGKNPRVNEQLHIDDGPLRSKINFPIYNVKDTWTEWYDVPDAPPFGPAQSLADRDLTKLNMIAEFETVKPVVFNSSIPHRIRIGPNAKVPRIQIAVMFLQNIDYMLE